MKSLYIKTKFGLKEILHTDDAAAFLKVKPSTLSAYLSREQVYIKKIRIKNLVFFYKEDLEKLIEERKGNKKDLSSLNLFNDKKI